MENIILPQASLFLGIIPALIFLYLAIKGYEGHYEDKKIFLTFVIGIIIGFVAAYVQSFTFAGVLLYIALLAFFDQLFKTIVLNIRRFQEKRQTVIYGLTLGLGFGSAFTPFQIIAASSFISNEVYVLILISIGSIGIILFHGATGAYIGYGIYIGKLTRYLFISIIIQMPFNLLLGLIIISLGSEPLSLTLIFVILTIIYGAIIFYYVTKKIMTKILEQSKRRKRKKNIS